MNFTNDVFSVNDEYMTPYSAWDDIIQFIPNDKVIWECFYGDGSSGEHLTKLGKQVIHKKIDFYQHNLGDIVISNPPFSAWQPAVKRLVDLNKPFILIMPSSRLNTRSFQKLFGEQLKDLQIIVPKRRIQFVKLGDEQPKYNRCNFDCFYYCWKFNLERDINWLSD